jgi:beta-glucanase (GH16 family)/glutaredoxin
MLDLTGYKLTFDDEFNSLSISQNGDGTAWRDIRPGSRMSSTADIGFGDSAFVDPSSGVNPFSLQNGALDITAVRADSSVVGPGQWASGLISTQGNFSQEYGYFEMRAELPNDTGVWPAFWMLPTSQAWPPEVDAFETYGGSGLYQYVHTNQTGSPTWQQTYSDQPTMPSGYHTIGVAWDPQHITFYFDGQETGQQDTPADMHQTMYLLADLAMQDKGSSVTNDPKHLNIDYIRAYSNDPNATAVALDHISSPDGANTSDLHGATAANTTNAGASTPATSVGATSAATSDGGNTPAATSGGTTTTAATGDGSTTTAAASGGGTAAAGAATPTADGTDGSLTVHVSADHYAGDPQFVVFVDGQQIGAAHSVQAIHSQGQWQDITVSGNFDPNTVHHVDVQFINDAWDGQLGEGNDRNLYVGGVTVGSHTIAGQDTTSNTAAHGYDSWDPHAAVMVANGTAGYDVLSSSTGDAGATTTTAGTASAAAAGGPATAAGTATADGTTTSGGTSTTGTGQGSLTLHMSADHYAGDPQFEVFVDGHQIGGVESVQAVHSQAQWQDITVAGDFDPAAAHNVEVRFVNDAWDGQLGEGNDRNLYVGSVTMGGQTIAGTNTVSNTASHGNDSWDPNAAVMVTNGSAVYNTGSTGPQPASPQPASSQPEPTQPAPDSGSGPGTLTLHISGDHYAGDPEVQVFVDGQQVGGTQDIQASHANGQWQDITLKGNFDPNADHQVQVKFIDDAWDGHLGDGHDRNVYVGSVTVGDHTIAGQNATSNTAEWGQENWDPHAAVMVTNGTASFSSNPHDWLH